jgi:hypothetical protein
MSRLAFSSAAYVLDRSVLLTKRRLFWLCFSDGPEYPEYFILFCSLCFPGRVFLPCLPAKYVMSESAE